MSTTETCTTCGQRPATYDGQCNTCRGTERWGTMCTTCGYTMGHSPSCPTTQPEQHTLTVFNAVDLPDAVASEVMRLLQPYNPDVYTRECDAEGYVR